MATPDNSSRRLRLVDDQQDQPAEAAAPDSELTAKQAAAFAALVANANQSAVEDTLDQMNAEQLRALAIALATQVNAAENATGEVADVGPDGICAIAIATAAQSFGTTRDAVLSADRHRAVTDARAVAMTAARRGGLTLPAIAAYFGKDHTSVMYAQNKVANNPRLNAVCARIVDQLDEHYAEPTSIPAEDPAAAAGRRAARRSSWPPSTRPATTPPVATRTKTASGSRSQLHPPGRAGTSGMLNRDQQQLLGSLGAGMAADALLDRLRERGTLEGGRSAPQDGCWINYNRKAVWLEDHSGVLRSIARARRHQSSRRNAGVAPDQAEGRVEGDVGTRRRRTARACRRSCAPNWTHCGAPSATRTAVGASSAMNAAAGPGGAASPPMKSTRLPRPSGTRSTASTSSHCVRCGTARKRRSPARSH